MNTDRISDIKKNAWHLARRRLSYIAPDNAQKVLRHDRYWTSELLQLFLQRCETLRLSDPQDSWKMVRWASELASLIRIGEGEGELASRAEKASWLTRALALEGEVAGLVGRSEQSDAAFARAVEVSLGERIQVVAGAELQRRRAAAALREKRFEEARRHLDLSLELFRRLDPGLGLSEALLLYGCLGESCGLVGLAEALAHIPPKGRLQEGIYDACLTLLLDKLDRPGVSFEEYEAVLGWLYVTRKNWFAKRSKSRRKLRLVWAEGRALSCLGLGRLAQRRLSNAWLGLSRLGDSEAMAVAGVDLVYVLIGHDERPLALEVLGETRQRVRRMSGDGELSRALGATEDLNLSQLGHRRRALARRWLPDAGRFYPLAHPGPERPAGPPPADRASESARSSAGQ